MFLTFYDDAKVQANLKKPNKNQIYFTEFQILVTTLGMPIMFAFLH